MMILVMARIHQDNDNVLLMSHALVSELNPDTMMIYLVYTRTYIRK